MAWLVLVLSAFFEAIWATALGMSDGLSRPLPTLVFLVATTLSMLGLGWAAKFIPIGTAYAVWVGIGATLTASYAMASGDEAFSLAKALLLIGIVGCVVGLKLAH